MQIITKAEARAKGLKFFYTGPCRNGHDAERYVSAGACVECLKEWKTRNPAKVKAADAKWEATRRSEYDRVYRTLNRDKVLARERAWFVANTDKAREYARRHREKHAEHYRAYDAQYQRANRGRYNAHSRTYQLAKDRRTPPWLTDEQRRAIEEFYIKADRLTRETGVVHHVDHVVPLRGRVRGQKGVVVSGLHVPWNLCVVPEDENRSKSCYFDPDDM